MKLFGALGIVSLIGAFGPAPAIGHDCGHHGSYSSDCQNRDHHGHYATPRSVPFRGSGALSGAAGQRTVEGKISEVIYLPGSAADNGMVEIRLQSADQIHLVRLAPTGFLKQGGLRLREGETVSIKGYSVAGMDGDIFVATDIRAGEKKLSLRDARGTPLW